MLPSVHFCTLAEVRRPWREPLDFLSTALCPFDKAAPHRMSGTKDLSARHR
jgi:hypothetical protein